MKRRQFLQALAAIFAAPAAIELLQSCAQTEQTLELAEIDRYWLDGDGDSHPVGFIDVLTSTSVSNLHASRYPSWVVERYTLR